jgi:hypothetical protein
VKLWVSRVFVSVAGLKLFDPRAVLKCELVTGSDTRKEWRGKGGSRRLSRSSRV